MFGTIYSEKCGCPVTRRKFCILLLTVLALLMASGFRLGLVVSVGGKALPGIYTPFEVIRSVKAAEDAAGEILCRPINLRDNFSFRPGLCTAGQLSDARTLQRSLIEQVPEIGGMYTVKIDGNLIGWIKDQSELGEMLDAILSENCQASTVSAGFIETVTSEFSYAPEWAVANSTAISKVLRASLTVEVLNIEPIPATET